MGQNTAHRPERGKHVREAKLLESPPFSATPLFSNTAQQALAQTDISRAAISVFVCLV